MSREQHEPGLFPIGFDYIPGSTAKQLLGDIGMSPECLSPGLSREARTLLLSTGKLLLMKPPKISNASLGRTYLHHDHTVAALAEAPHRDEFASWTPWLRKLTEHLDDFATTSQAHGLVVKGLADHYKRIADAARRLPGLEGTWIRANKNPAKDTPPLAFMAGRLHTLPYLGQHNIYHVELKRDHATYVRTDAVARHIGWVIPDILTPQTRFAVTQGLASVGHEGQVISPYELFVAGNIIKGQGQEMPLRSYFPPTV